MAAPRKDNVKAKILTATEQLLQDHPVDKISLSAIAEAAGISKGTLYYHYKNKEDILFDLADRYFEQQYEELFLWTEDEAKDTSLHRLFTYVLKRDVHEPTLRFQMLYSASRNNEELRTQLNERYNKFQKAISEKIAERVEGISPDFLAWTALILSDGLIVQSELGNPAFDANEYIEQTDAFIRFLRGHGAPPAT